MVKKVLTKKTWLEKIQSSIKKGTGDTENKVLVKKKNFFDLMKASISKTKDEFSAKKIVIYKNNNYSFKEDEAISNSYKEKKLLMLPQAK